MLVCKSMLIGLLVGFAVFVRCTPVPSNTAAVTESHAVLKDVTGREESETTKADATAEASTDYGEEEMFLEPHEDYRSAPISHSSPADLAGNRDHSIELQGGSQTFFPSFANLFQPRHQPLGHSRPLNNFQEGAYSQRASPLRQLLNYQAPSFNSYRSNDYAKPAASTASSAEAGGLLGSGNFGVIRGGTFFSESSDTESSFSDGFDSPYYNNNNGHGRPSFYFGGGNPRPNYNEDQFANFRDFADINAPSNPAYSHFVVVYANKNATLGDIEKGNADIRDDDRRLSSKPKNIMETLAQIDREQESLLPGEVPEKKTKISKNKQKLALIKNKKHVVVKKSNPKSDLKDLADPLLALS